MAAASFEVSVHPPRRGDRVNMHHGRSWHGHEIEDECPCPKAECGLISEWAPGCEQHDPAFCRTLRQGHWPSDCPARDRTGPLVDFEPDVP